MLLITRPLAVGVAAAVVLIALPALAYTGVNAYHGWERHHPYHSYPGDLIGQPGNPDAGASASAGPSAAPSASASPDALLPAGGRPGGPGCTLNDNLVPTCGVLFGVAPGAFTSQAGVAGLPAFEQAAGRSATILHLYHKGDEMFPTASEIASAEQPGHKRVLLINYKPDWGTNWANVARGGQDGRIDKLAGYIKSHYTGTFYLAIHHEPENEVNNTAGSGMTAKDFAAMFRHTVQRFRADGVTNLRFTVIYMGYQGWAEQSWFDDLYPGDDVVDWIGIDPYSYARAGGVNYGSLSSLVNGTTAPKRYNGFYNLMVAQHPSKPLMVAEWGVFENTADLSLKPRMFQNIASQLQSLPAIRALVYFDSPAAPKGDTRINSSPQALAAYRSLSASSNFDLIVP
jgi:hypothetical protein